MKLLIGCVVAGFMMMLSNDAESQNQLPVIQGRLILQNNQSNEAALIVLINLRDSMMVASVNADHEGVFSIKNITHGEYLLKVTCAGYKTYTSGTIVLTNKEIKLPPVTLTPVINSLKEISVTSKKNYIEHRQDRTILNVESNISADGVNVLDVLNAAPGVRINAGGDVLLKEGQKAAVALNGKVINLSSQDIAAQLLNLPAGSVARVEIIPNPSAKYDAAGSGGLVNIVLKKGTDKGLNGSYTQGFGYGNFGKTTSVLNINYRNKELNFFGNYSFGFNKSDHTIITDRTVGANTSFNVNYYNKQLTYANNYNFGADYSIDEGHTIGVLVTGYFSNNFLDKNTISKIAGHGMLDSTLNTISGLNRRFCNVNYNLNYSGKLGKTKQTLSADADYSIYNRTADEHLTSILNNAHTGAVNPADYTNNAPSNFSNISIKVDYANPMVSGNKLEAGLKSIATKVNNAQYFDQIVNNNAIANTMLSSKFDYTENITSAYINFSGHQITGLNYQFGLRAEHTESTANTISEKYKIKRSYTDYFPTVVLNYKAGDKHELALSYTKRIDRPNYQDLNPIIAYQDKYNFTRGNAYLRPSYTDRLEFKDIIKSNFTATVYAQYVRDAYNFTYFTQNDATGVYISGKSNLNSVRSIGVNLAAGMQITSWWHMDFAPEIGYLQFADSLLNKKSFDATFKLYQQLQLPAGCTLSVNAQYEVPTFYTIYSYRSSYYASAGLRKQLLNKKASVSFTVSDLFNTDRDRYSSTYANLNLIGYDKKETRIFRFTFLYRFGRSSNARKHVNGNSDDLGRLGNVN